MSVITAFRKPQTADDLIQILSLLIRDSLPSVFVRGTPRDGELEVELENEHEVTVCVRVTRPPDLDEDDD